MSESPMKECIDYFKSEKGFKRAFSEMYRKLESLGHVGGRVSLRDLSEQEKKALGGLFGIYITGDEFSFLLKDFEEALEASRFENPGLMTLVESYTGKKVITAKEKRELRTTREQMLFDQVCSLPEADAQMAEWLRALGAKKVYGKLAQWDGDDEKLEVIRRLNKAVVLSREKKLKGEGIRLAVLASEVSGQPHYFDRNKTEGKLLIEIMLHLSNGCAGTEAYSDKDAESILKLYIDNGIRPDDISSFVTAYGIRLGCDGTLYSAYEDLITRGESYVVTLSNLARIDTALPKNNEVYIVENQMVFSELCERCPNASFVCTSGQIKTAALLLIDLLCQTDAELYYSGDLDPEGVQIADRLVVRSKGRIRPLFMDEKVYLTNQVDEVIGESRLKKLEHVTTPELKSVSACIQKNKRPAYQEQTLEKMIELIH